MKINKKLVGHAIENATLIVSGLVLYEVVKLIYEIFRKKYPKKSELHKASFMIGNILMIIIIDIIIIILMDEFFNINVL